MSPLQRGCDIGPLEQRDQGHVPGSSDQPIPDLEGFDKQWLVDLFGHLRSNSLDEREDVITPPGLDGGHRRGAPEQSGEPLAFRLTTGAEKLDRQVGIRLGSESLPPPPKGLGILWAASEFL